MIRRLALDYLSHADATPAPWTLTLRNASDDAVIATVPTIPQSFTAPLGTLLDAVRRYARHVADINVEEDESVVQVNWLTPASSAPAGADGVRGNYAEVRHVWVERGEAQRGSSF